MAIILASILDCDWNRLEDEIKAADAAGVDGFSIDVMDGEFVPRTTFGPEIAERLRKITDLPIEVHLMVNNPEKHVTEYCDTGADQVIFQIEAAKEPFEIIKYIHSRRVLAGVSLLVETELSCLTDDILGAIDALNFMAVPVGYGGQPPSPSVYERIRAVREMAASVNPNLVIEVDGGVKPNNCAGFADAGADALIMGTGIYKAENYKAAVDLARNGIRYDDAEAMERLKKLMSRQGKRIG